MGIYPLCTLYAVMWDIYDISLLPIDPLALTQPYPAIRTLSTWPRVLGYRPLWTVTVGAGYRGRGP